VTIVPNARIAGVALTGLHGYKAVATMGKTFELDGRKRVLCKQEAGRAHKSEEPLFHTFPCFNAVHCTAVIFGVDEFSATGAADLVRRFSTSALGQKRTFSEICTTSA
jgi:uncharacterized MAPEG superfamily protein